MTKTMRMASFVSLLILAPGVGLGAVSLPTFTVNSLGDGHDANAGDGLCQTSSPGICTLRAAIEEANTTSGATVMLPVGTINLSLGALSVTKSMTITGAGMKKTVIHASLNSRIVGVDFAGAVLTLTDLTLKDGNLAAAGGGGVSVTYLAELNMSRCLVTNCHAGSGGGVWSVGNVTITDSHFTGCHAESGSGGAIELFASSDGMAQALLNRTTLSGNFAASSGGAVHLSTGYGGLGLLNCTVSGNHAGGTGGGIRGDGASVGLTYCTVTDNQSDATLGGGGLSNGSGTATDADVYRSLLAGNYAAQGQFLVDCDCAGSVNFSSTILGVTAGCTTAGFPTTGTPSLGLLRDNGGYAPTHALLDGSVGLDGSCLFRGTPITNDQRGVKKPVGTGCDYGAYERAPCGDADGNGVRDVSDVFFLINHLFAGGALPPGLSDVNGDTVVDVSDVFALINALFAGGQVTCPGT